MRVIKEMATEALRRIDWTAVDTTTDEEIARQVAGNPDAAQSLSDAELERANSAAHEADPRAAETDPTDVPRTH